MEASGWRTVIINSRAKLSYSCECMKISRETDTDTIHLDQIKILIINTCEASLTSRLICELNYRNVKIIFCDNKQLPNCEICGYSNNTYSSGKLNEQIYWDDSLKTDVWTEIIKKKIKSQYNVLALNGITGDESIKNISDAVTPVNADSSEAIAAKQYFCMLFGNDFNRRTISVINDALNYGYAILLSSVSRAIVLHGYNTGLGLHHRSQKNPFNLSCDIMEPFRPFIDNFVYTNPTELLDWNYKQRIIALFSEPIKFGGKKMELQKAIDIYVSDVLCKLSGKAVKDKEINFYGKNQCNYGNI